MLHHGAGSSGLTFALLAEELRKAVPGSGVLAVEARGHGETVVKTTNGQIKREPYDLSLDVLSSDLSNAVRLVQGKLQSPHLPDMILVGHSLGGPVVTDVAQKGILGSSVLGYAVLDVVEGSCLSFGTKSDTKPRSDLSIGSAMDALQKMNLYLATRPKSFTSLASGIEWQ